jgi:hypothetical protein
MLVDVTGLDLSLAFFSSFSVENDGSLDALVRPW